MSYFKCFKSGFHEYVSRFIVLLFIINVVVGQQIGKIITNKTNYSNNEPIEIGCQYNSKPDDVVKDYFNLTLHRSFKSEESSTNYIVNYNDPRYDREKKSFKVYLQELDIGVYKIECCIHTKEKPNGSGIDIKDIYVGTIPEPVQNFTCMNLAFDKLVCSFDEPYNPVHPDYTVEIRAGNQNKKSCILKDVAYKGISRKYCTTENPETGTPYKFIVRSQNSLTTEVLEQQFEVNVLNVTVPAKVNLKLNSADISSADFSFPLEFSAQYDHDRSKHNYLIFNLTLESSVGFHSPDQFQYSINNTGGDVFSLIIKSLPYPHHNYSLTLRSKMMLSPNDTDMYYSEPTYYNFSTTSTRPYKPPRTNMGAFEVIETNRGNKEKTEVTIFWEALKEFEHNGPNFRYVIKVYRNGKLVEMSPIKHSESSATFEISHDNDYNFEIFSKNDVGSSSSSSSVFVSKHVTNNKKTLIEDVWKVTNDEHVNLTWYLDNYVEDFINFTVFWCTPRIRDDYSHCKSSINFEEISKLERSHIFQDHGKLEYNYGISLNFRKYSTGIVWNSCSTEENIKLVNVKNFVAEKPAQQTEIGLRWSAECQYKATISGYNLKYCLLDNSDECVDQRTVTLGNKLESHRIHGLKPYSRYKVSIGMIRRKENILYSHLINETSQAAPSPPQNLTVANVTSSSVFLKWTRPEEMNGVFKTYKVYYNNNNILTNSTNITLTDLEGQTEYNLKVVASTIEDSEPTNNITIHTEIGKPSEPKVKPFYFKDGRNIAEWEKPVHPNAHESLRFYEVRIGDQWSLVTNLSCTLDNCDNTLGDFELIAVNAYESKDMVFEDTYNNDIFENKLCSEHNSTEIYNLFKKGYAFHKSKPIKTQLQCNNVFRANMVLFAILFSSIFIPAVVFLSIYKFRKISKITSVLPPGLGFDSSPIKNNIASIPHDDDDQDVDSEQTMETTENEFSTLTGKEYNLRIQEIEKTISEKPKPFYLTNNSSSPVIESFAPVKENSGYVSINPKPNPGYILIQSQPQPQPSGYVTFPLEPTKIKNESEYFAIETEESPMPAPQLMSGYVTPAGNFYK
ncbi:DOME.2 family protein [Megaselia abdita]